MNIIVWQTRTKYTRKNQDNRRNIKHDNCYNISTAKQNENVLLIHDH